MGIPAIYGLATGVPATRYTQGEIFEYLAQRQRGVSRHARAIFQGAGIAFRYVAVQKSYYAEDRSTGERNQHYLAEALPMGEATIRRCLDAAGYTPDAIDDFTVVSCTGLNIPGLDLHLAARLGMRPDLQRTCILGMGCYGAFPGMRRAWESVAAAPGRLALVLSLELCSLHLQLDQSAENVVSTSLFADGAAMVIIGGETAHQVLRNPTAPRILASKTYCDYSTLDHMSFTITDHGFQMYLSSYVPDLLASNV